MFMKRKPSLMMLGGPVAWLLYIVGAACGSGQRASENESVSNTEAADTVAPPSRGLAGNSNYWITAADPAASTGLPITGLHISIAITQDLHIPNGMSIQLNGWSAPSSNIVWQQYGFSVTPPSLGWGIENWPTAAYGAQLGLPAGGSLNFSASLAPSLPAVPYGPGILPAGYTLDIVFQEDANGNVTGTSCMSSPIFAARLRASAQSRSWAPRSLPAARKERSRRVRFRRSTGSSSIS